MIFLKALGVLVTGVVVVGGTSVYLALSEAPKASCADGRVTRSVAAEASFNTKWNAFDAALSRGETATVTLTEEELSSRGARYISDSGVPAKDLEINLCANQSKGQAALVINALGRDIGVIATGHLDVSISPPRIVIDGLQVGQVPEQIAAVVANQILELAKIPAPSGIREVATTSTTATLKGQR